jgi:hypothetical protein
VNVSASGVIVADNQIYVRGATDGDVTAILVKESSVNLNVHDNLIRNCGRGIVAESIEGRIQEVLDPKTFLCVPGRAIPFERRQSHGYRGWNLAWLSGARANTLGVLEGFDPESLRFTLRQPTTIKANDRFALYPPSANWTIHDNTVTGCQNPVVLDCYGSPTSTLRDNLISRGDAADAKQAIQGRARFNAIGNHVFGFDAPRAAQ